MRILLQSLLAGGITLLLAGLFLGLNNGTLGLAVGVFVGNLIVLPFMRRR